MEIVELRILLWLSKRLIDVKRNARIACAAVVRGALVCSDFIPTPFVDIISPVIQQFSSTECLIRSWLAVSITGYVFCHFYHRFNFME